MLGFVLVLSRILRDSIPGTELIQLETVTWPIKRLKGNLSQWFASSSQSSG
jgi:hypothetical protein